MEVGVDPVVVEVVAAVVLVVGSGVVVVPAEVVEAVVEVLVLEAVVLLVTAAAVSDATSCSNGSLRFLLVSLAVAGCCSFPSPFSISALRFFCRRFRN